MSLIWQDHDFSAQGHNEFPLRLATDCGTITRLPNPDRNDHITRDPWRHGTKCKLRYVELGTHKQGPQSTWPSQVQMEMVEMGSINCRVGIKATVLSFRIVDSAFSSEVGYFLQETRFIPKSHNKSLQTTNRRRL